MLKESCRLSSGTDLVAEMLNSFFASPAGSPARLALQHDDMCSRYSGLPLKTSIRDCAENHTERASTTASITVLCILQELDLP